MFLLLCCHCAGVRCLRSNGPHLSRLQIVLVTMPSEEAHDSAQIAIDSRRAAASPPTTEPRALITVATPARHRSQPGFSLAPCDDDLGQDQSTDTLAIAPMPSARGATARLERDEEDLYTRARFDTEELRRSMRLS
jgi:hypothetical protein